MFRLLALILSVVLIHSCKKIEDPTACLTSPEIVDIGSRVNIRSCSPDTIDSYGFINFVYFGYSDTFVSEEGFTSYGVNYQFTKPAKYLIESLLYRAGTIGAPTKESTTRVQCFGNGNFFDCPYNWGSQTFLELSSDSIHIIEYLAQDTFDTTVQIIHQVKNCKFEIVDGLHNYSGEYTIDRLEDDKVYFRFEGHHGVQFLNWDRDCDP